MTFFKIDKLTHHFDALCSVHDFSLDVQSGELVGLIGPNGAGKTTVFNLITGVYEPTNGQIIFEGHEIQGHRSPHIIARGISRTFQNIRLFSQLTVLENVQIAQYHHTAYSLWDAVLRLKRFRSAERRLKQEAFEFLAYLGLEKFISEKAKNLPYGLQRRLEIARALASHPKLLLLDEPAAGMNPQEIGALMMDIKKMQKDYSLTIILIEHQMQLVMGICDRIKVLDFGETIAEGSPDQIRRHPLVLTAYLGED